MTSALLFLATFNDRSSALNHNFGLKLVSRDVIGQARTFHGSISRRPEEAKGMRRTVWFSIVCIFVVALVAGGKILLPMIRKPTPKTVESYVSVGGEVGVKGDKLEAESQDDVPERVAVKTVKIELGTKPSSPEKGDAIASADSWRPAFASVTKRVRHVPHRHRWKPRGSRRKKNAPKI